MNGTMIIAGTAGLPLAEKVARLLFSTLGDVQLARFKDGEIRVRLGQGERGNARGKDVFIINPTNVNGGHDNLMELLFLIETVRDSQPKRITLVIPYLAYNRQDRKDGPRTPISSAVIIGILKNSGADSVLLLDMHSEATQGTFRPMKVSNLYASVLSLPYFRQILEPPFTVAAPDHGAISKARYYARHLGQPSRYVIFDKDRPEAGKIDESKTIIIGNPRFVKDCDVLLIDDIVDSGGTLIADAKAAKAAGARRVLAFVTHPVLSGQNAREVVERLDACDELDKLAVTDSIGHPPEVLATKRGLFEVITVSPLIANAIHNISNDLSVSQLSLVPE